MTDAEVIKSVKAGRTDDFSILVEKYHLRLLSFIYKIVRDGSLAEDIGQDVFLRVYKGLGHFDENRGTPFSAWLFITARNVTISEMRRINKQITIDVGELADTGPSLEQQAERRQEAEHLHATLSQLAEPYRTALIRSLHGTAIREIARLENVSAGTVKSRLFRAKTILTRMINNRFSRSLNE